MTRTYLFLALLVAPLAAQPSVDTVIDQLAATRRFSDVSISPDGRRVAWVEDVHEDNGDPTQYTAIYLLDLHSPEARPHRLTARSANFTVSLLPAATCRYGLKGAQ